MSADDAALSAEDRELLAQLLGESGADDGRIRPRAAGARAPLSFSQRRLWVAEQLRPGDPAYHLWVAFRATGLLDRAALAASLAAIVERHALLRSTVEVVDGEPAWVEHPPVAVPLPVTSLLDLPAEARADRVRQATADESLQPFDLTRGPLLRARVLHVGPDEHVLVLVMHHIVTDGWSMGVLFQELGALYSAFRAGGPSPLAPPALQYADFAAWQRRRLAAPEMADKAAAWRRDLAGAQATALDGDRPRGGDPGSRGAEELARLAPEVASAVDRLAREERATRFITLLTAFSVLLSRYAASRDVLLGIAAAGRDRAELEPLVGFFVNLLPFRTTVEGGDTFRALLRRVRGHAIDAFDRQDLPFDYLVDELGIARTLDRHPLFDVVFTAQDALIRPLRLADLELAPLELPATSTRFDLEAHVLDAHDGVRLGFVYRASRFEAAVVRRMLDHYVALVAACVATPDQPLDALPWVSDEERRALEALSRGPAHEPAATGTVVSAVGAQIAARPDAEAVACGTERLTYRELDRRARRAVAWLRARGVRRGDRVGILLDRTADFAVAVWAAVQAGAAYVPLDPSYPDDRLAYMAADSGMRLALTHATLEARLEASGVRSLCLDADDGTYGAGDAPERLPPIDPDDLAYVVYTSGSTGRPKGVEVTHAALMNLVQWHLRAFQVTAADCATQVASVGFDACVWEVWPYLAAGARLCLATDDTRAEPQRLWQWLRDEQVTIAFLPTPLAEAALRDGPPPGLCLRTLLTGGDRLTLRPTTAWPFALVNNYGPTENAVVSTSGAVEPGDEAGAPSIGGPIDRVQTYVLDAGLRLVPAGVIGELYVGGLSLARGYLGRPRQTAAAFVPDPFSGEPGARLYRTGDLVRWRADGTLDFIGRRDGQVKIRGFRIELGEIEAALARVPGVDAAVVIVHGEGEQRRLAGYVVPGPGATLSGDDARMQVRPWLPAYMVPAVVMVVPSLPLTAHGKIDRSALPAPVFDDAAAPAEPRTEVEATLQRIWREVLGVERIGVHENFFDVGGDSILSIQIASRATQAGLAVSPRQFFEHQTIAELAADIARASDASDRDAAVDAGPATGDAPLTPIQHWFFEQALAAPEHFNQAVLLELRQTLTSEAVAAALGALLRHHDALRSQFRAGPDGVAQHVPEAGARAPLTILDLSAHPRATRAAAITAECARAQASHDLAAGPLLRVVLFRMGAGDGARDRVLLVAHHLVVDGVSWRVLLEDLARALEAAHRGSPIRLPARTTSFRAWSEALQRHAQSDDVVRALDYWVEQAADRAPLPLDREAAAGANLVGSSQSVSRRFSRDDTTALLRAVPAATGCRVNEVLLAAVAHAVGRWAGHTRVHVDVEGHGREAIAPALDLSRTVGWFTSLYPMRLDVGESLDRALVSNVAAQLRAVPSGGIEFGVLRYLHPDPRVRERLAGRDSQISFNYLGQFDDGDGSALLAVAPESVGPSVDPRNQRRYLIEVNARVAGGVLQVDWTHAPALHATATVTALADAVVRQVSSFVAAALAPTGRAVGVDRMLAAVADDTFEALLRTYERPGLEDLYPLGPLQEGMVVHALRAAGTGAFVSQFEVVFASDLDPGTMREAWARLQARHPILRTAFVETGGGAFRQAVLARPELAWTYENWTGVDAAAAEARYDAFRLQDRTRGFELGEVPVRVTLVQLAPRRAHLVWTHHHALLDGWSVAMLLDELFLIHEAVAEGRAVSLEPRPAYRGYIEWLQAQDAARTEAFWRAQLAGVTASTVLASDRGPSEPSGTPRIEEIELSVDADATRALVEFAARHRLTLHTLVQGAWALLLARHSGDETIVFGTAVSGRPADLDGVERMVGLFLNGLPMRADVPADAIVHDWLAGLQLRHADLREHQHAALSDIQRWSGIPSGQPVFETSLAFENYPVSPTLTAAAQRLGVSDFRLAAHTGAALHLRVVPGDRLRLMLAYDAARFEREMAAEMLRQVDAILRQIRERPDDRLGTIDLSPVAAAQVPDRATAPQPADRGVHEDVLAVAVRHPERVAIMTATEVCTYAELDQRSRRVAAALMDAGAARGAVVGVYLPRGADLIVSLLGVLRAGCAFAVLDPAYPPARTRDRLRAADVRHVLHAAGPVPDALDARSSTGDALGLVALPRWDESPSAAPEVCVPAAGGDLAYLAFTSGSTGEPKAVLGRHGALAAYGPWLAETFGAGADDRFTVLTALSHDPLLRDIFPALQLGGTLCVPSDDLFARPGALADWGVASRVTIANLTPSMAQLMMEGAPAAIASLRLALFVGEPLTYALVERFRALAPHAAVVNLYGATETQQSLGWHAVTAAAGARHRGVVPAGRGMAGVDLLIVRAGGELAGVGEVGEIWVASDRLAGGYLGDRDLTASRFVADPSGNGRRAYRTGDRGWRLPSGDVCVTGRGDEQLKVRGFRVEPGEIEAHLVRRGAREAAAVVTRPAEGPAVVVAYVGGDVDTTGWLRALRDDLPAHLVPARIVALERLPRTVTGKVDRRALAALAPEVAGDGYVPPVTPLETRVATLWADVLQLPRVGLHDNFFELGGHSILAARLAARLREALAVDVQIPDVFRHPRVADLAPVLQLRVDANGQVVDELLDELAGLSEAELRALLEGGASTERQTP